METLKQILSELREIKKVLQTIASSLECEKCIDMHQAVEVLEKPWSVGDMKAVINLDTDAVVKKVLDALTNEVSH